MSPLNVVAEGSPVTPPSPSDAPAGSVLAQLRARAGVQQRDRTLDVPFDHEPWGGLLVARYQPPPMEDADRLIAAAATLQTQGNASVTRTSVDVLATCCQTLLGRAEDGGLEDLGIRYTGRLLTLLELPLPTGVENPNDVTVAEVLAVLFGENWLAVNVHAGRVMTWLQKGGETLGEGSGAS